MTQNKKGWKLKIPPWRPSVPPAALHGLNASLTGDYILYSPAPTAPGLCLTFGQFDKIHLLPEGGILQLVYCRSNRLTYYCILELSKYYFVIYSITFTVWHSQYENILRRTKKVIYFITQVSHVEGYRYYIGRIVVQRCYYLLW